MRSAIQVPHVFEETHSKLALARERAHPDHQRRAVPRKEVVSAEAERVDVGHCTERQREFWTGNSNGDEMNEQGLEESDGQREAYVPSTGSCREPCVHSTSTSRGTEAMRQPRLSSRASQRLWTWFV